MYPSINWWTFQFLPLWGCYEQCWHIDSPVRFCVDMHAGSSFLWGVPGCEIDGSQGNSLTFWGTAELFSSCTSLQPHQQHEGSNFFTSWPTIVIIHLFDNSHPSVCDVVSHCVLTYVSLMANDTGHLFMCLSAICMSLEKCLFRFFPHFCIESFLSLSL